MLERLERELSAWKRERVKGRDIRRLERAIDKIYLMHTRIAMFEEKIEEWVFPLTTNEEVSHDHD